MADADGEEGDGFEIDRDNVLPWKRKAVGAKIVDLQGIKCPCGHTWRPKKRSPKRCPHCSAQLPDDLEVEDVEEKQKQKYEINKAGNVVRVGGA